MYKVNQDDNLQEKTNLVSHKKAANKNTGFKIGTVTAKTTNQKKFMQNYDHYQVLSMSGWAGTGKTYCALAMALKSVENGDYDHVMILRSAVASRDMGFQPGNSKEKMAVYEGPYVSLCNKLYGRGDAYEILKQKNIIQFVSTSFLRGETFDKTVLIIDEAQNMAWHELYTILTRIGEDSKVIICGDSRQDDLTSERFKEVSGYQKLLLKLELVESCYQLEFTTDDIVRSGFVKEFIVATNS